MDASKIKLIIWDLDETFWNGTISEQKVAPVKQACDLVLLSSKKGIVNSICSKNDEKPCIDKLKELGFGISILCSIRLTGSRKVRGLKILSKV